jgi:hyaluronate lyase
VQAAVVLQPTETASKDTFVYQGFGGGLNFANDPLLPVGQTTNGHTTETLIEFDLSGVSLTAAEIVSATLELYQSDTALTGFGANPSPGPGALTVNLYAISGAWNEATVSWNTKPAVGALYASQVITSSNQTVSFDVTNLVKDWKNGAISNFGLTLQAAGAVGSSPNWVYATFESGGGTTAVPKLTIVPEPSSVMLALSAFGAAVFAARGLVRRGPSK